MADDISIIFLPIEEGEGFGLGGFGGIEEPFWFHWRFKSRSIRTVN